MAALGLLVFTAVATPLAAAQWYTHYQRGLELAAAGRCAEALVDFEAAARLGPGPQARVRTYGSEFLFAYDPAYRRAACLAELGRWQEGLALLATAEAARVTPAAELAAVRQRLEAQRRAAQPPPPAAPLPGSAAAPAATPVPRAGRVRPALLAVDSSPAGAAVAADGRPIGIAPLSPVAVAPGRHRVRVTAAGHEPWEQVVTAVAGETLRLEVALRPLAGSRSGAGRPAATGAAGAAGSSADVAGGGGTRVSPPAGVTGAVPAVVQAVPTAAPGGPPSRTAAEPPGAAIAAASPPAPRNAAAGGQQGARDGSRGLLLPLAVAVVAFAGAAAVVARGRRRRPPGVPPRRLGRYRLLEEVGRGGMATTYRALRDGDGAIVAVKVPHAGGDPTYPERFLREGRLGERLHHPNLVRILDVGEDGGTLYLVMELVPGRTLRHELDDRGEAGLPVPRALEIATAIAEALDYAHGKGVVHRDLKPENVMVLPGGTVKVLDFGVARVEGQAGLTTSQVFFGSPLYAAPELVEPRRVDPRSDLYSLGAMLFEMVAGRPPFVHESVFRLLELHQHAPLPLPESLPRPVPAAVWELLERLLAKEPAARLQSAEALLVELRRLRLAGVPGAAVTGLSPRPSGAGQ